MKVESLISELEGLTEDHIAEAKSLRTLPLDVLNHKPTTEEWSILECFEHLNRYGRFYVPEVRSRLDASRHAASDTFRSGWLGGYFAKSMLPREKLNKMKTFSSMNPNGSSLSVDVIDEFIDHQEQWLQLLERSAKTNLTKVRTSITISNWIRLRLGDTLRVVIYHNLRHMEQIKRTLAIAQSVVN